MNTPDVTEQPKAPTPVACSDWFCFRWWYKGITAEGNTMKLEGRVEARDASEACDKVEKQMRAKWPTVRWMQGREIEGDGVTFGPTVQKLKTPITTIGSRTTKLTPLPLAVKVERKENYEIKEKV